ncbi:hypothetical protein BMF29_13485 [Comamonas kerstersii]|nr:hypothetical protein BMF38_08245 [Comamonas kerstersii]OOH89980.1 hypothetical protein BMF29_13485 [Comamonas kerstersii]
MAAKTIDAGCKLFNARRFISIADATFDGPLRRSIPDTVNARAEFSAKDTVSVISTTQRKLEVVCQAPLIFHEECFLGEVEFIGNDAVHQIRFPVLAAKGSQMISPRGHQFCI